MSEALRYRAFLSYAHKDENLGIWLHKRLENYRIPSDLIGKVTPAGVVPKTLRRIFRDREDFSGGQTLADATIAALDESASLIVLCSPTSALRPAVNEEVRLFRHRHPERPIIPVVIDGSHPTNFPPALRFELNPDGSASDRPWTILGPDLREGMDGKTLGVSKIVAGLLGLATDEIARRAERDARKRLRAWISGLAVAAASFAGLAFWAEIQRREAVEQREEAERNYSTAIKMADGLVVDVAQGLRGVEGLRVSTIGKVLTRVSDTFDVLVHASANKLGLLDSKAAMIEAFGDTYLSAGFLEEAKENFQLAHVQREAMVKGENSNRTRMRAYALSFVKLGDVATAAGNLQEAQKEYEYALEWTERLLDQKDFQSQQDVGLCKLKVGSALVSQGRFVEALENYKAALAIRESLTRTNPANPDWQRDLADAYKKIGDAFLSQDKLPSALTSYRAARFQRASLVESDPDILEWKNELALSLHDMGDVVLAQGQQDAARDNYEAARALFAELKTSDSENIPWQANASINQGKLSDLKLAAGDATGALQGYRRSREGIAPLSSKFPNNYILKRTNQFLNKRIDEIARQVR